MVTEEINKCPICGNNLYKYLHNPTSDYPECEQLWIACVKCDYNEIFDEQL